MNSDQFYEQFQRDRLANKYTTMPYSQIAHMITHERMKAQASAAHVTPPPNENIPSDIDYWRQV